MYVIHAYVFNSQTQRDKFKNSAKKIFREKIVKFLERKYVFYEVKPETNLEDFVEQNFRFLAGKMYRPSGWEDRLLLAFEKGETIEELKIAGAEILEYKLTK